MKTALITMSILVLGLALQAGEKTAGERLMYESRDEIPEQYRWDLTPIMASLEAWDEVLEQFDAKLAELSTYEGRLGSSAETLAEALEIRNEVGRLMEDLYVYANQSQHLNTRDADANRLLSRSQGVQARFSEGGAFIRPEIAKLEPEVLDKLMAQDRLAAFRHYVDNITRSRAHIRSEEVESVVASASLLTNAPVSVYSSLVNADIQWPSIEGQDGEPTTVVPAQFYSFMSSQDRRLRRDAAKALFETFDNYSNTLAGLYSTSVNKDVWLARTRGYESTLEAALAKDNIPRAVVDNLITTVQANYDAIHQYVALRQKVLGIDDFHLYDLYVSMVPEVETSMTFDDGWALAMEFWLETFGEEYAAVAKRALDERWVDVYTNTGKRGGAYSWGTYNSHPYLLLNWGGELDDAFVLVHEMGHSIHSYLANQNQPFHDAEYSMFVAEVASVASESLFFEWMMARTDNPTERLAMLNYRMNSITGTFLRQAFFHQFEAHAHAMAEAGQPMTKDSLGDVWSTLFAEFYGSGAVIDPEIRSGWGRIPHFYRTFYVWVYATSFAAGEAIAARVREGDMAAVEDYIETLKLGGSVYPMQALERAGVNMNDAKVIETVMHRYREILAEMEKLLVKTAG